MRTEAGKAEGNPAGKTTALRDELLQLGERADRHGTKVLRDNLDLINHLVAKGVSLKSIYDKLIENGFRLTYKSFVQTLKVVRKDNRNRHAEIASPPAMHIDGGHDPPTAATPSTLQRPPGITNSAWAEMQQKHRETQRRQQQLKGITK